MDRQMWNSYLDQSKTFNGFSGGSYMKIINKIYFEYGAPHKVLVDIERWCFI